MVQNAAIDDARTTDDRHSVLRRLLRARNDADMGSGRAPQLPQLSPPTPARAAATAVGRVTNRLYHLPLQPISVTPGAMTLPEIPELLPESSLLIVLQGPGEALGLIALCQEALTALVEVQTLGRITARHVERRKLTRADALICSEFVNALMGELEAEMTSLEGFEGISGFRYATFLDDPRPLALMLEDKPYRSLDFRLRLGGAETRDAHILLALPHAGGQMPAKDPAPEPKAEKPVTQAPEEEPQAVASSLSKAIQMAPVELIGILCRRRVTLGEIRRLAPGQTLSLPRAHLSDARVETPCGQLVAKGRFGESDGCHAIRLHDPLAPSMPDQHPRAKPARAEPPMDDLVEPDAFRNTARGQGENGPGDISDGSGQTKVAKHG